MSLSTDAHITAALTALDVAPFRYWVTGFTRTQMRRVAARLAARFPERGITLVGYFPRFDQCVIYDTQNQTHDLAALARIAQRRDAMAERGIREWRLPR